MSEKGMIFWKHQHVKGAEIQYYVVFVRNVIKSLLHSDTSIGLRKSQDRFVQIIFLENDRGTSIKCAHEFGM